MPKKASTSSTSVAAKPSSAKKASVSKSPSKSPKKASQAGDASAAADIKDMVVNSIV